MSAAVFEDRSTWWPRFISDSS